MKISKLLCFFAVLSIAPLATAKDGLKIYISADMEGIDTTFDGVIFIGYHASTTNTRGVRAHTMSSANVTALRLNGISMSEGSMNAAIAGHFGVPVIMVSGDDVAVAENHAGLHSHCYYYLLSIKCN